MRRRINEEKRTKVWFDPDNGAMYHVMSRGDQRDDIFFDDVDRYDFIKTLAEACLKTDWQVQAFCLMKNHYPLVIETPNANLVAGMAWLQSTYTIRLNKRHRLTGHVLSGRYKAPGVERGGLGSSTEERPGETGDRGAAPPGDPLTIKAITALAHLGTYNSANARPHQAMNEGFACSDSAQGTIWK